MIGHAVLLKPDAVAEQCIRLWEDLAAKLSPIIGDGGFATLFARCMRLALPTYPWLPQNEMLAARAAFKHLRAALHGRDPSEAAAANVLLLSTFIDTLTLLIGEALSTSILREAWGDDVVNYAVTEPSK